MDTQLLAKSSIEKWLITVTVMLVAVMEVLDITIVNVAMREMMGTFGATITEITWVITAYVVASAIVMPLTGFLVENFGRRKILLINIIGFMITSILCGTSTSMLEMIIFRALQGIFGASLIPLSQFILRTTFEKKELGKAMAIWAMGIMVGPILGPTLGGYITENMSWHWIFFINVPVCIVAFVMTLNLIKETPITKKPVDWFGMACLAIGVGCFQTFIEEGYHYDWFSSHVMLGLFCAAIIGIVLFLKRSVNNPNSVVDLDVFRNRQFVSCVILITLYPMALFGAITLQPLMTEVLMKYPSDVTGLIMAPRGIASLICMPFIPMLMKRVNAKIIIALGLLITAYGTYIMSQWNLQVSMAVMATDTIMQGIGMSMVFGPVSSIVYETMAQEKIAAGAGIFSFGRNIGLSIGVAAFSTVMSNQTQINWNRLGAHISSFNSNLIHWLNVQHLTIDNPIVPQRLASLLYEQANMIAYLDVFWLSALCFIVMIPFVLLIEKGKISSEPFGGH